MIAAFYIAIVINMLSGILTRGGGATFISAGVTAFALIIAFVCAASHTKRLAERRHMFLKLKYGGEPKGDHGTIAERIEREEWNRLSSEIKPVPHLKYQVIATINSHLEYCKRDLSPSHNMTPMPSIRGTIALRMDKGAMAALDEETKKEGMIYKFYFVPWRLKYCARLVVR